MTAVKPIAWHEECLLNATAHCEREAEKLAEAQRNLAWNRERLAFYGEQIAEAKRRGVSEFDRERFMKSQVKRLIAQKEGK